MNHKKKTGLTNRILNKSIFISILCFIPSFIYAQKINKLNISDEKKPNSETDNPSGWNQEKLLKTFIETNEGAKQYLAAKYNDKELAEQITDKALEQFKALAIELPDVGGEQKNIDAQFIPIAAWYLAYYRAMKPHNMTAEDVGRMIYDLNTVAWKHFPKEKAKAKGCAFFSKHNKEKLKAWAKWTQKKQYPANWIMEYVPGEEEEFDFGYNYSHCGVCMYLYAYDAVELAPFVCLNDFTKSKALNTGLHRTKTIAAGDGECNFRFKEGREVTQDWDTEIAKIRERIKAKKTYHP